MDNISLKAADICKIIKECNASGVSEFQYQGIQLKFHPRRNEDAVSLGQVSEQSTFPVQSDLDGQDQMNLANEESLLEAEEAQLLIDDPAAFERTQIDRHIERGRQLDEKV